VTTLLLVHAHPDDEAIMTGGVMQKAHAEGHRVVLVTATRGEVGEIHNMDEAANRPILAEVRAAELAAATEILGVDRQEFLDYRDSGMAGTDDNQNPASFHQAQLDQAAERLAAIIRTERPEVVVTYDPTGTYFHPDHIKAHQVTTAALDLLRREGWEPRKFYWHAFPRSGLEEFAKMTTPPDAPEQRAMPPNMGVPDEQITTVVDVRPFIEGKMAAFKAHTIQNGPEAFFLSMPNELRERAFGEEHFVLARGELGVPRPEPDLFAGVDG
jgi:N-acetyl-1-D-myo-inositol-2-amino-2-deoxy-alpha-D-glucopyranoside deacetylase